MEKKNIKSTESNTISLDQFKNKFYGEAGTAKRDKLETGYANFKAKALKKEAQFELSRKNR